MFSPVWCKGVGVPTSLFRYASCYNLPSTRCAAYPPTVVLNAELMIMGFISLGVFLTLQFGSVGSTIGFYTFEFAHIVVFFTTLIFVMQVHSVRVSRSASIASL